MRLLPFLLLGTTLTAMCTVALDDDASQATMEEAKAAVHGSVISWADTKTPYVPIYLFDFEQSSRLRRVLRDTQKLLFSRGAEKANRIAIGVDFENKVARIVPTLPTRAKSRTGKSGSYRFADLIPGKQYYVVAFKVTEDGVFYAAGLTPVLKPGQELKLDLREIGPDYYYYSR